MVGQSEDCAIGAARTLGSQLRTSTHLTGLPGLTLLHEVHGPLVRGEQDPLPVEVHVRQTRCAVIPGLPGC